jgi:predicted dithiol-disulfide oxidoreductase (DUF899 family)
MVAISRAPYPVIAAYRQRMGWGFPWLSSAGSDFNFDYRVSFTEDELAARQVDCNYRLTPFSMLEAPGASVFSRTARDASSTPTRPTCAVSTC